MTDDSEGRILDAISKLGIELREELQALRRGIEYVGERLFGSPDRPEFQSKDELAEFRSRIRRGSVG